MRALPTTSSTLWLFTRLRARRLANTIGSRSRWSKGKARAGTASKASSNPLLMGFLGFIMAGAFFNIHWSILHVLGEAYPLQLGDFRYVQALAAQVLLGMVISVLMTLGGKEFARAEWDLEWLITLPVSKGRLMWLRIGERTFVNPISFLAIFPLFTLLWAMNGLVWWLAPFAGYLTALPIMLLISVIQTLVDTGVRVHLQPSSVRNLQGVFNIFGVITFYLTLGLHGKIPVTIALVNGWMGPALVFLPPGLSILVLQGELLAAPLLAAETALFVWAGYRFLIYLLRSGVIAGSGQNSARGAAAQVAGGPRVLAPKAAGFSFSPMFVKELRLLSRDRNYMVQTLFMPLVIIALQVYMRMDDKSTGEISLQRLGATAFGMITYALMFSVLNLLNSEGAALWVLYTFPRAIKDLVMEKAKAWLFLSLLYWAGFAVYGYFSHGLSVEYFVTMGLALAGVPIFVVLAMALGIFSFNPHAQEAERRLKTGIVYLYMLMAGTYAAGFFQEQLWTTAVGVILVSLVAYAFWQRATDHLPYLLDPTEAPPAHVSLSDGMIAAYGFFVLQTAYHIFSSFGKEKAEIGSNTLIGFALAGFITCGLALFHFRRTRATGIPSYRSRDWQRDLIYGLLAGVTCAVFAHFYLEMAWENAWFTDALSQSFNMKVNERVWLSVLAVVAAPIFEEFIFRGMVYKGLAKTARPVTAIVASALLFASMHPPVAVVPVFVLGVTTAFLYRRSGSLLASTFAHAVYNFCVMIVPWLLAR